MKKIRLEMLIFIVEFVYMVLELTASRILSPYFGSSNIVWTSVIGIILLSSSLGNFIGGKIADIGGDYKIKIILGSVSTFIFFIPFLQEIILSALAKAMIDIKIGAIISTIILFFIPSIGIGMISPNVVKMKVNDLSKTGRIHGTITAIGTLGGIAGTFIGGFLIIPYCGSVNVLYILSIMLSASIILVDLKLKDWFNLIIIPVLIASIVFMSLNIKNNNINKQLVLNGDLNAVVTYDSEYGHIKIYNTEYDDLVRILDVDGGYESCTYIDPNKKYELAFNYSRYYNKMFDVNSDIENSLLIGGGGYSYPKYYISHFLNKNMDVVELDSKITEIAKEYFFLNDLIEEYNLNENNRLNLITGDGRVYINNCTKKYDAILNDAFLGEVVAENLTTIEAATLIKNILNVNGCYLSNVIGSLEGYCSKFLRAEVNTLRQVFNYVYVIPCYPLELFDDYISLDMEINNIVVCCDNYCELDNVYNLTIDPDEMILTDEYCSQNLYL